MTTLPPFWSLVEAHSGELMSYARRLVGDEAPDVVQEAYVRALRSYPRLRHADHLRAWLYRITTTAAFDHSGKGYMRKEVPAGDVPEPAFDEQPDHFEDLVAPLPESARTALSLRFVDDLSYDDIAAKLGCSVTAARQRVSSAVRTLRGRLA
jgi:RNA polymerase sigma-70 factor (ECF subfamily)